MVVVALPPGDEVMLLVLLAFSWSLAMVLGSPRWSRTFCSVCPEGKSNACSAAIFVGSDEEVAIMGTIGAWGTWGCGPHVIFVGRLHRLVGLAGQLFELTSFCVGLGLGLGLSLEVGVSVSVSVGGQKCS